MYSISRETKLDFSEALEKVKEELKKEGFGVLTEIDIKATLKKKLDVDRDNYVILGACNPPNADKALNAEIEIGLMLPCNVIVYEKAGKTFVSAIRPSIAMSMIENPGLKGIAGDIEAKLERVISGVS
ncbi:DUF302 domain-containing protein [Spirochaeta isovalerica]|uniref:Uncharacterized protein (DUF302 family) n=1 Tax=Spirochaeta isovalerica TaxID=150 RepID=A0A841RDW3_9SPIO|nr:DUF302 domain-containing protein [Spirochaeta isovalerica]MBB6481190.1 uncharacterized protein (DUF302 family) [Spirochaeta isovalerica]